MIDEYEFRTCTTCGVEKGPTAYSPRIRGTGRSRACDVCRLAAKMYYRRRIESQVGEKVNSWVNPSFLVHQRGTAGAPQKLRRHEPRAMATRVLLKRHEAEWRELVDLFDMGLDVGPMA